MKKINKKFMLFLYLQMFITLIAIVFVFLYFFGGSQYLFVLQLLLAFDFIVMGINNKNIYRREHFTLLYFVFGILILSYTLLQYFGVL